MQNEQNNNPSDTVTSEQGVSPEVSSENVDTGNPSEPSEDALKRFSEGAGREFSSLDDAVKWASHTNSMVGDQTVSEAKKKAEAFDSFLERIKPLAEKEGVSPESYLDYSLKANADDLPDDVVSAKEYETKTEESKTISDLQSQLEDLSGKAAKADLLREVPGATEHYDDFVKWATGAGVDITSENFKSSPFNGLAEVAQKANETSVIESSAQVGQTSSELEQSHKDYKANPSDANADKMIAAKMKQVEG